MQQLLRPQTNRQCRAAAAISVLPWWLLLVAKPCLDMLLPMLLLLPRYAVLWMHKLHNAVGVVRSNATT
jgi:hypothetical protein